MVQTRSVCLLSSAYNKGEKRKEKKYIKSIKKTQKAEYTHFKSHTQKPTDTHTHIYKHRHTFSQKYKTEKCPQLRLE